MKNERMLLIGTPVVVIPSDWSDAIDRRAVFRPEYGWVKGYSQKEFTSKCDNSEFLIDATDVQLKNGNIVSVVGLEDDTMGVFDRDGFIELIIEEKAKIDWKIKRLQSDIDKAEEKFKKIDENNEVVRDFWKAQIASWKQSVKFFSKKKGKLEDLGRKASRKLDKMNK